VTTENIWEKEKTTKITGNIWAKEVTDENETMEKINKAKEAISTCQKSNCLYVPKRK